MFLMLATTYGLKNTHLLFPPEMVQLWFSSHAEIPPRCSPEPHPEDSDAVCSQLQQVMRLRTARPPPGPGGLAGARAQRRGATRCRMRWPVRPAETHPKAGAPAPQDHSPEQPRTLRGACEQEGAAFPIPGGWQAGSRVRGAEERSGSFLSTEMG